MNISSSVITAGINKVVDLIQQFLPLIPVAGPAAPIINTVVDTLQELSPLIINQVETTKDGVKNIINAVSANPNTTAEQMKALRELDKKVDDAWDAIEAQLDPDAPGNS